MLVEKPMATTLPEAEALLAAAEAAPGAPAAARRTSCSPRPTARCTRGSRPARSAACCRPARATAGPGPVGALVLRARRRRAVRPRDLQRHEPVRLLRPGPPRDRDDRRRHPRARHRRRARAGAGRGQRARPDRLRRRALRGRHDRLHDAALPLAGDRALRHPRRDADARRRLGARGPRAVAQRRGVLGAAPGGRPALAVDRRPAPPRRVHRDRRAIRDPPRARLPRARDHARRPGRRRRRPGAGDHERLPGARTSTGCAVGGRGDHRRIHDPRSTA